VKRLESIAWAGAILWLVVWNTSAAALLSPPSGLAWREFTIEGVRREALVYAPARARTNPAPVVFVFHGHGGNARQAARSFALHQHWAEAIVVYPQGLNTPGRLTDPDGRRPGWQSAAGDQGDRDLKFFDIILAWLQREYRVEPGRICVTGHSNGGAFCYLLWAERGDVLAALAPSAASASPAMVARWKPKPVLHLAGRNDPLVKFVWQQWTMAAVRRVNGCDQAGRSWGERATLYPSTTGAVMAAFIHEGGHAFPSDGGATIARFFVEHARALGTSKPARKD